ncbi:MAG: HD domain-containing protein [Lachnospiraceae bacterium]|nr:HD domain-containing protein [Lachnospiraceae bacterium]
MFSCSRPKALQAFQNYVSSYEIKDDKTRLKIEHTMRVATLCEKIARNQKLSSEDVDLAWIIGLLHDIGRFEQLRQFGTFEDGKSINHAHFGCQVLFDEGHIHDFLEDHSEDKLIYTAIHEHSAYRPANIIDDRTLLFCNIIRDADKIDIFRVNVEFPLEVIYNVSGKELIASPITKEVFDSFLQKQAVKHSLKSTVVDRVVGHISLVFELVFPISLQITSEQGYLEKIMSFRSSIPETNVQFSQIRNIVHQYLAIHEAV